MRERRRLKDAKREARKRAAAAPPAPEPLGPDDAPLVDEAAEQTDVTETTA